MRQTAVLATRSAACLWNKVLLGYSREYRVEMGIGNSFTAVAEAWGTLQNLLMFSSHAFFSEFNGFSNPSRIRAGESGWFHQTYRILRDSVMRSTSQGPNLKKTKGIIQSCLHQKYSKPRNLCFMRVLHWLLWQLATYFLRRRYLLAWKHTKRFHRPKQHWVSKNMIWICLGHSSVWYTVQIALPQKFY